MKGRIAQRAFYDRLPGALARRDGRLGRADRPPLRPHAATATEDAERSSSRWARSPTRPPPSSTTSARPAAASADRRHELPAVPGDRARRGRRRAPARSRSSSGRTSPLPPTSPLSRDLKAALWPASPPKASDPARADRVGRARLARCRARRPGGRVRLAARRRGDAPASSPTAPRHPPPARAQGPPSTCDRPAPSACAATRSAGFGSVTTNKLVATLVGDLFGLCVQAYPRYGSEKKGLPTTYYLTFADEPIRGHAELDRVEFVPAPRRERLRPRATRSPGLADGGTLFVQSPLRIPRRSGPSIPSAARGRARRAPDPADGARYRQPRPRRTRRGRTCSPDAGRRPRRRLPAPDAVRRAGRARPGRALTAVRAGLRRFFGKRGSSVVDANLARRRAAYDGLIDVTASIGPAGPRHVAGDGRGARNRG